jgi:hypothetical protein
MSTSESSAVVSCSRESSGNSLPIQVMSSSSTSSSSTLGDCGGDGGACSWHGRLKGKRRRRRHPGPAAPQETNCTLQSRPTRSQGWRRRRARPAGVPAGSSTELCCLEPPRRGVGIATGGHRPLLKHERRQTGGRQA